MCCIRNRWTRTRCRGLEVEVERAKVSWGGKKYARLKLPVGVAATSPARSELLPPQTPNTAVDSKRVATRTLPTSIQTNPQCTWPQSRCTMGVHSVIHLLYFSSCANPLLAGWNPPGRGCCSSPAGPSVMNAESIIAATPERLRNSLASLFRTHANAAARPPGQRRRGEASARPPGTAPLLSMRNGCCT